LDESEAETEMEWKWMILHRLPRNWALVTVIILIVLYSITFSVLSIRHYDGLDTGGLDLGVFDQVIWNTSQGRPFQNTILLDSPNYIGKHLSLIPLLLAPLYRIWPDPRFLLIIQSVLLALGALPVFWLAREKLENEYAAFVFAAAYLLSPALESANLNEFHPGSLSTTFLLYAFYFFHRIQVKEEEKGNVRRQGKQDYLWFAVFAVLAIGCKEDIPLLVAMMGLYILVVQRHVKLGLATLSIAILWFWLALYVIIPRSNPTGQWFFGRHFSKWGDTPLTIALSLLTHPQWVWEFLMEGNKLVAYLYPLLAPIGFLSLLSPETFLVALPSLVINFFGGYWWLDQPTSFLKHYVAPAIPFVMISGIWGTNRLVGWLGNMFKIERVWLTAILSSLVAILSLLFHYSYGLSPLSKGFIAPAVTPHDRLVNEFAKLIPPDASLITTYQLTSHFSQRREIYQWPDVQDTEYVLLDIKPTDIPLLANDLHALVQDLLENRGFGILASKDGYILLKRGVANRRLSDDFYSFLQEPHPTIQYPMKVNFGPLQLAGFNIKKDKTASTYLELYWRALEDIERDYNFFTFLADEQGKIVEDSDPRLAAPIWYPPTCQLAAPIWYPTSQWKPGELVKMETLHWTLGKSVRFGIALAVLDGPGQWDIEKRLRPKVIESDIVMPLLYYDTLLELVTLNSDGKIVKGITLPRQFAIPPIRYPLQVNLGDQVKFLGYDLDATAAKPGGSLHLTIYWQALIEMDTSYTVFTHLLAGDNRIWGQKDGTPFDGIRPTTSWALGEVIVDEYDVPIQVDTPPGKYLIEIGMYELTTGQRLPVLDAAGTPQDNRIILGEVWVAGD
jgi:uncharacterized membrane protein